MKKRTTRAAASRARKRVFDVRRDTLDFRDKMYVPTLIEVPTERELNAIASIAFPSSIKATKAPAPATDSRPS